MVQICSYFALGKLAINSCIRTALMGAAHSIPYHTRAPRGHGY